jgi:hypothetical protein
MKYTLSGIVLLFYFIPFVCYSQDQAGTATDPSSSSSDRIINFPSKFFSRISGRAAGLDQKLSHQTDKYLRKLAKKEASLKKKLYQNDAASAKSLFVNDPEQQYAAMAQKLQKDSTKLSKITGVQYMPYMDSLQGSLSFLKNNPQLLGTSKIIPGDIQNSLGQLQQLQSKMQDAEQIRQFIQQRKDQINRYLSQYTHLPAGVSGIYSDYNKQLYYYTQQVQEYKEMLNDPDKMFKTVLQLLDKLPAFTGFMKSNSFLSGLFDIPADYGSSQSMLGLQTRDQVMSGIQSQLSSGGPGAMAAFNQNMQSAQQQLQQIKDKLSSLGAGGENVDNSRFKPNNQKTKSLFRRLEYGSNMQTVNGSSYFPTTTDLGLSVGYKLNNKTTIGVGASYKMGWGNSISHIHINGQGAGLRSFLDIQMKGNIFAAGGFEYNYQRPNDLSNVIGHLKNWQQSGLIGVSKIIPMNTKFFKKTKIQFLWDFLSYRQIPRAQPIKFRIGYNF